MDDSLATGVPVSNTKSACIGSKIYGFRVMDDRTLHSEFADVKARVRLATLPLEHLFLLSATSKLHTTLAVRHNELLLFFM